MSTTPEEHMRRFSRKLIKSGYVVFGLPVFFLVSYGFCLAAASVCGSHPWIAVLVVLGGVALAALAAYAVVRRAPLLGVPDRYIVTQSPLMLGGARHLRRSSDGTRLSRLTSDHQSLCGESLGKSHDLDSPRVRRKTMRRRKMASVCASCANIYESACNPPAGIRWDSRI